jgi:protoporphyrinogen oxidase
MHVAVLGGGACGMSAALELTRLGIQTTVLEREPRVGGLCGTHEREGFRFDFGGHRVVTQDPAIDRLVRDLVGGDLLERERSSAVLNGGKRYRYPLQLDDVLRQFGPSRGARALGSYALEAVRQWIRRSPEPTFEDWVTHRFGSELYATFFGPYTEKLWGIPAKEISADWAAQRISLPSLLDVAVRLIGIKRPMVRTYARRYLYPRRGIGQIFERCATLIQERGGVVRTGAEVLGIARGGRHREKVRGVRFRDPRGEHELACDAILSTVSLPAMARMLGPLPAAVERSAGRLRFRAIRLFQLLLDGPPVSPHTWMYVSEPGYLMARIQEPIHRSPDMAPAGATSLMLELPCDQGDAVWSASDDAIRARVLEDLQRLGFAGLEQRVRGSFSAYVREGYPIYHLGYAEDRSTVLEHLAGFEGLLSCGRQGAFRYIFMDTAMEMGIDAARELAGGRSAERSPKWITELGSAQELLEAKALTA